tara:strand:+ start:354 stop:632 length:279 start_codon:yes stop_codon:yes gene_type:complete
MRTIRLYRYNNNKLIYKPLKPFKMTYIPILTDPTEWNEPETQTCNLCSNYLTPEEVAENNDDNGLCNDCFFSCCGDELDQDNRRCKTCKEHN